MTLPYDPKKLKRELKRYYISATEQEKAQMLKFLDLKSESALYAHIGDDVKFATRPEVCKEYDYFELAEHMQNIAGNNNIKTNFIGDGLKCYSTHKVLPKICDIRGLTTAYTPYQPERCQGTLMTLWLYASAMSELTGMEAINASLYDRSTCLFEALKTAMRLKKKYTALVCESLYPGDIEVLNTHIQFTELKIITVKVNEKTGTTDINDLNKKLEENKDDLCALAFPQVSDFGVLEQVHELTDLCHDHNIYAIASIDPISLNSEGLISPNQFGTKGGAHMIVAEGQSLALGANYGGPGLGVFGIRYTDKNKNDIRQTAGRFIGKAKDVTGRDCLSMVLSTREQHIRRDKATSNICSNQSFVASLAGAALMAEGDEGLSNKTKKSQQNCQNALEMILQLEGVDLAFDGAFFDEVTLELSKSASQLIKKASDRGIHLGVDVSKRLPGNRNLLKIFFSDELDTSEIENLFSFFKDEFSNTGKKVSLPKIEQKYRANTKKNLPSINEKILLDYYNALGDQNVSPDHAIYPLGSCTMKYNPYINDYAASLEGFTKIHPQAPECDAQGSLQVLYEIQKTFSAITGLPGVVTQPVAGAQGELVGIKMFQAYHADRGENRDVILIPRSAHGTNPATATMAGLETKIVDGKKVGIVLVEAKDTGLIDFDQLKQLISEYKGRIAGVMVTNPNTSGVFETDFKKMADLIHEDGGLVYMDGANMNAIASWVDLGKMGVDAVHNNLHKTWTIPHGGGGPGDAIVAVSEKLLDYMPGVQVVVENGEYKTMRPSKSVGSFHRHFGNFAHKVRALTYIKRLGSDGIREMAAMSVLSSRYLYEKLKDTYPTLPRNKQAPKMHEFIITLSEETEKKIIASGLSKAQIIARVGKLFLDFGMHAPTVAFPEPNGLMIEPTESFSKDELDRFCDVLEAMSELLNNNPEVLQTVPHFTPIDRVDEISANKNLVFAQKLDGTLPNIIPNRVHPLELGAMPVAKIKDLIIHAHEQEIS